MAFLGRISGFLAAAVLTFGGTFLLSNVFVTGSSDCDLYEFPCEDGGCVDSGLWCDTHGDCEDGSDEKYCKKSSVFKLDPNKCPSQYFRCSDGPCIPLVGQCDGYDNCDDSSDERDCSPTYIYYEAPTTSDSFIYTNYEAPRFTIKYPISTTTATTTESPKVQRIGFNATSFFASLNTTQNIVQAMEFEGLHFSDFSEQRNNARNWIVHQKRDDYGWGDETHRSITALRLSDEQPIARNTEKDLLIKLSLELSRNGTKPMKPTDIALYINALLVICKDPRNFYGDNMVSILRGMVDADQRKDTFVNPSVYLTLCINDATDYDDIKQLHDIFFNWNASDSKLHMQSLALLTTECVFRKTNFLNESMYQIIKMEFLRSVKAHGFPGNVYEAALLFQALQEMKVTLVGLTDFILRQQKHDGSFGDILSTYLVLPILSGRNLLHMIDYCGQQNTSDLLPLEVLKNVNSEKMHVQYSLIYGVPPEVTQTIRMLVKKGINFLDIMRLAQDINPIYRFKLSEHRDVPIVYMVGDTPNDVEKGMYWKLYKASENSTLITSEEKWIPYYGDIKKLILTDEDKMVFWYRQI